MKAGTAVAVCVAAAAAVGAAWYVATRERPAARAAAAAVLPDLRARAGEIGRVAIRRGDKSVTLARRGTGWVVVEKGDYPADAERVRELVSGLADAKVAETKTSKPELYPRLGVEDPAGAAATGSLVTLTDEGGTAVVGALIIGKSEPMGSPDAAGETGTYVRRPTEAASLLARGVPRAEPDAMQWVGRGVAEIANERVRAVTVRDPEGPAVEISRATAAEQKFTLAGLPEGRTLKDEYVLTRLAWALASVTLDDVAPAGGVDMAGATVVELRGFDGLLVTARLVKKEGKWWATLAASFEAPPAPPPVAITAASEELAKEIADLNAKWGPWAYQLPEWKATAMAPKLDELLAPAPQPPAAPPAPATPVDPPSPLGPG